MVAGAPDETRMPTAALVRAPTATRNPASSTAGPDPEEGGKSLFVWVAHMKSAPVILMLKLEFHV